MPNILVKIDFIISLTHFVVCDLDHFWTNGDNLKLEICALFLHNDCCEDKLVSGYWSVKGWEAEFLVSWPLDLQLKYGVALSFMLPLFIIQVTSYSTSSKDILNPKRMEHMPKTSIKFNILDFVCYVFSLNDNKKYFGFVFQRCNHVFFNES